LAPAQKVAFKRGQRQQIKSIKPNVAEVALSDMPDEHALAGIVGRRLGEFTGTGNIAAADIEPVAGEPPFWNSVHTISPA